MGSWIDPLSRQLLLRAYAESWLAPRPDLKIRTRELYQWLLNKYVLPQLGDLSLDKITPTAAEPAGHTRPPMRAEGRARPRATGT